MILQLLYLLGWGVALLLLVFTATWAIQLRTKNAGIVDPIWSLSFPLLAVLYLILAPEVVLRGYVMVAMVAIWGGRLGIHLLTRVLHEDHEDVRYAALRKEWGAKQNWLMLRFYYFQAILAVVLSLPFALTIINPQEGLNGFELVAIVVWIIALSGEAIADHQLKSFRKDPANKGKVCQSGLWNYSRHPNYFFEWLTWVAFFLFAVSSPFGYITIICPLLMLYFLLKVTGIPYTEAQSVKSKGAAYIEYQRTTSSFIPLPKRSAQNLKS